MSPDFPEYGLFDFVDVDAVERKIDVKKYTETSETHPLPADKYLNEVDSNQLHPRPEGSPNYVGRNISWMDSNGIRIIGLIRRSQYVGGTKIGGIPEFRLVAESNGKRFNVFMVRDFVRWEDYPPTRSHV